MTFCDRRLAVFAVLFLCLPSFLSISSAETVRSQQSGKWTSPATWENKRLPAEGDSVLIRPGHQVLYDRDSEEAIRAVHIAGELSFAKDKNTRLDVGLIRIAADESMVEEGFDCITMPADDPLEEDGHHHSHRVEVPFQPALIVGSPNEPIPAEYTALIRLVYFEGMEKESLPAIVCCAGGMDFHGAPLERSWVKLTDDVAVGENRLVLSQTIGGWKVGDQVLITGTKRQRPFAGLATEHVTDSPTSEVRRIAEIHQSDVMTDFNRVEAIIKVDEPMQQPHRYEPGYAAEVANLSRNVIVESADPDGVRGHTMYHRDSAGAISHAEFRHLGKEDVLGRYALHYHLVGDTMRGSYVWGASIWDSANRWIAIHSTQYLIVRDCIGYRSIGHGFFLEDGSEVFNILDRNLAVQALVGKPLPKQALPFDHNDGAGFWWANSLNTFTRNVAVECDQHAFRFEAVKDEDFNPEIAVPQPDGTSKRVDIRTIPFIRFEDNEAHAQRRFAFNLGGIRGMVYGGGYSQPQSISGDVGGVGPDSNHPFIIKNLKVWDSHWAFHSFSPSVFVDGLDIYDCQYGIWRSIVSLHEYRDLSLRKIQSRGLYYPMGGYGPKIHLEDNFPTFPILKPVDDLPPFTVITHTRRKGELLEVRGTTTDNNQVSTVLVNDYEATATRPNFAEWKVNIPLPTNGHLTAHAIDDSQNTEPRPHVVMLEKSHSE
ncbi:FG-GAP repeat-containing protein [Planctomycetales bacterium 10988]|nr:FG-GAP repeat-containing protein [Planctomycetales bacterium 10988]